MRSNTSLLGRILMGIALRLEILTKILKIIFNQNLFCDFRDFCVTFYWWAHGGTQKIRVIRAIRVP